MFALVWYQIVLAREYPLTSSRLLSCCATHGTFSRCWIIFVCTSLKVKQCEQQWPNESLVASHTEHCHLESDFLLLFSLQLKPELRFSAAEYERLLDDASGLLVMSIRLKPESDVCISSFLISLASDAIVGVGESCLIDSKIFVLFGGLLHNFRWVSVHSLGDSHFFSTVDVMDEGGVGLKLEMVQISWDLVSKLSESHKTKQKIRKSLYFYHLKISTADFVFPHITHRIDLL